MKSSQNIVVTYEAGIYTATFSWEDNIVISDGNSLDELVKNFEKALEHHVSVSQEVVQVDIQIPSIHFVYNPMNATNI